SGCSTSATHIYEKTNKPLRLKDIHNIKAKQFKDITDWEATLKNFDYIRQRDPGATIDVFARDSDSTLEMIILQTTEMKKALAEFPEVLQMDGTYKLNKAGLPLYGLLVEDRYGHGQLVGVVLTRGETCLCIESMLESLKENNPAMSQNQIFIVDKDFSEINAIVKVLPSSKVHLCVFHVLKAM
ncbi:hypothetical protein CAPTEDRAFT_71122, partial [Capitella teleta]